jgi:hypothetical protein
VHVRPGKELFVRACKSAMAWSGGIFCLQTHGSLFNFHPHVHPMVLHQFLTLILAFDNKIVVTYKNMMQIEGRNEDTVSAYLDRESWLKRNG